MSTTTPQPTSSPLRSFPTSGFEVLDPSVPVEEETLPTYSAEKYYPVHIGEVLGDRYQVVAKIGFGVTSTVWLGRDISTSQYAVLKVYVTGRERNHEIEVYERIEATQTDHLGKSCIRKLLGHFSIDGPHGRHVCLVHEPLGLSLYEYLFFLPGRIMEFESMKACLRQVIATLDWLHTEAGVIHTDLQLKNLLLPGSPTYLSRAETVEMNSPTPRKVLDDGRRTIHTSQIVVPGNGLPLLSDMGECRFVSTEKQFDEIMPNAYRAPEVILHMGWDEKVDIWNVAMLAWDIVSSRCLFQGWNADDIFADRVHVAEMVALLGPPPRDFVERSKVGHVFWDENNTWKDLAPIPDITLESLGAKFKEEERDKQGFYRFLRKALQWKPEDRPTARELINDEWLLEGLGIPKRDEVQ
ncbi:CMGC protein kinase [Aspergillus heteromorphus CBS 117.55]|uniref:non-specific serine/threonine protein kinase n=1 Tax=Aspergillus heteromorphus CBS 117.55 TaxID=1448321 RepID=A0A317VU67_9EURO|nr:CMGC protein kinase [Aspergillus heteromorphus CBS 117.55]PWY75410.1 CMGC protein kinase [Aspergillus heteromorphus CBS 117.55]